MSPPAFIVDDGNGEGHHQGTDGGRTRLCNGDNGDGKARIMAVLT